MFLSFNHDACDTCFDALFPLASPELENERNAAMLQEAEVELALAKREADGFKRRVAVLEDPRLARRESESAALAAVELQPTRSALPSTSGVPAPDAAGGTASAASNGAAVVASERASSVATEAVDPSEVGLEAAGPTADPAPGTMHVDAGGLADDPVHSAASDPETGISIDSRSSSNRSAVSPSSDLRVVDAEHGAAAEAQDETGADAAAETRGSQVDAADDPAQHSPAHQAAVTALDEIPDGIGAANEDIDKISLDLDDSIDEYEPESPVSYAHSHTSHASSHSVEASSAGDSSRPLQGSEPAADQAPAGPKPSEQQVAEHGPEHRSTEAEAGAKVKLLEEQLEVERAERRQVDVLAAQLQQVQQRLEEQQDELQRAAAVSAQLQHLERQLEVKVSERQHADSKAQAAVAQLARLEQRYKEEIERSDAQLRTANHKLMRLQLACGSDASDMDQAGGATRAAGPLADIMLPSARSAELITQLKEVQQNIMQG